jgi:hypothetical protein
MKLQELQKAFEATTREAAELKQVVKALMMKNHKAENAVKEKNAKVQELSDVCYSVSPHNDLLSILSSFCTLKKCWHV